MEYLNLLRQKLSLNKRQKIIVASFVITIGLMYSQTANPFIRTKAIMAAATIAFFASYWALSEGMSRVKAFTLLLLPTLFTLGVGGFYFLLPIRWLTRLPVGIAFGISMYFLLLSQNVFNVAASRTIPLYRAASTVTFLFTIFTGLLLFHILHAFSLPFIVNGLAAFAIAFLLISPILWTVEMEALSLRILIYSIILALIIGEFAIVFSFWPIPSNSLMWAMGLTSALFVLLGFNLDYIRERLSPKEPYLYLGFAIFVLSVITATTSWSG